MEAIKPGLLSTYDFIFSERHKPRVFRHIAFWLLVWIFYLFTYFLPYYWYPGWNTANIPAPVAEVGWNKFYLIVLLNSSFGIVNQIFFTYVLIYFLLPKYLSKEKYKFFVVSLLALLIVSIVLFFYEFKYGNPYVAKLLGRTPKVWATDKLIICAVDLVLFNCPAIGGIALGIKILKTWWLKQKETQQLITATSCAKLQLLKAQVHPHFLFNTLNNIYSFTLSASPNAPGMIRKLSGLLHYIIHECDLPKVPLEKELKMIKDYMALEQIRYGDEIDLSINITGDHHGKIIAPLLLIPFVENSFKHGTSKMLSKPSVNLNIIIEEKTFLFMLNNSRPEEYVAPNTNGGIGLSNVYKRLELIYPRSHELKITEEPQHFTVLLMINLEAPDSTGKKTKSKTQAAPSTTISALQYGAVNAI